MHEIGNDVLKTTVDLIKSLLMMHGNEIDEVYRKEENSLSVALSPKFKPSAEGGVEVNAGINFVTSRVKDGLARSVVEGQQTLFERQEKL